MGARPRGCRPRQEIVMTGYRYATHLDVRFPRTRAPERTVILMAETAGIVPTGDP
jgi:hypothetical protein